MRPTTRARSLPAALGAFALLATLVSPVLGVAPSVAATTVDRAHVLTHGHVDGFETTYDVSSGMVVLHVKDDTRIYDPAAAFRAPETTTFAWEDERSVATLPAATGPWSFLGTHGGGEAYLATQSGGEQAYAPWVGWSTERLLASLGGTGIVPAPGQPVSLDVQFSGPGDVFAFQTDAFGGPINRYVDTTTGTGTIPVSANAHVHTNWIFTAAGDYTVVVTPSLATTTHGTIPGVPATYHFRMGPAAPTHSVTVSGMAEQYDLDSSIELGATLEPAVEGATFRWELRDPGADEFAPLMPDFFTSPSLNLLASADMEGIAIRVVAISPTGQDLATSEPQVIGRVVKVPWEAPQIDTTPVVLSDGHIDLFNLSSDDDGLVLSLVDDTRQHAPASVDRAPDAVTVSVDPALARTTVPAAGYDFLGAAGDEVFVLPSSQTDGLPWPGWTTNRLDKSLPDGVTASDLRYEITVEGPGHVSAWSGGMSGTPTTHFDSGDAAPDVISVVHGAHVHTSWGFTEQGTYILHVVAKGSLSDGREVSSDTETYTFQVGTSSAQPDGPDPDPIPEPTPGPAPTPDLTPEPAPDASEPSRTYTLTHGHVDGFEVSYDAASKVPVLSVKDDSRIYEPGSVYRSPAEVTLAYQDERAWQQLPAAEGAWHFLGEHGGEHAWIASQTGAEQERLPWVGWSTERLLTSLEGTGITLAAGSPVSLEIAVEGPGDVFTFQNDSFGNPINRYIDTTTSAGGIIPVTANAHVHTNWVYTAPGDYHLTVTPRLTTADGAALTGEPADYHVRVGAFVPPWQPLADADLTDANRGDLVLAGSQVTLGAEVTTRSGLYTEGQELTAYAYSEPTNAGHGTAVAGAFSARVPASIGAGEHKLAVYDSVTGTLIGWSPFTAAAALTPDGDAQGAPLATGAPVAPVAPEQCIPTAVTTRAAAPATVAAVTGPAAVTAAASGVTTGHFDFGSRVDGGALVATLKDDRKQPASWLDPSTVTFRLGDAAKDTVPEGSDFAFLGSAGAPVWSIGQVQEDGVPWLGWNTQHPTLVAAAAGPVTYTLDAVDGPGQLAVYATGNFGGIGTRHFGTVDGFPRSTSVPLNQHVHGNWAFTAPGSYAVTITQSVQLQDGGTVADTSTLTFTAGEGVTTVPAATATEKTTYVGKTTSGADCVLSAAQQAALASTGADMGTAMMTGALAVVLGALLLAVAHRARWRQVTRA